MALDGRKVEYSVSLKIEPRRPPSERRSSPLFRATLRVIPWRCWHTLPYILSSIPFQEYALSLPHLAGNARMRMGRHGTGQTTHWNGFQPKPCRGIGRFCKNRALWGLRDGQANSGQRNRIRSRLFTMLRDDGSFEWGVAGKPCARAPLWDGNDNDGGLQGQDYTRADAAPD